MLIKLLHVSGFYFAKGCQPSTRSVHVSGLLQVLLQATFDHYNNFIVNPFLIKFKLAKIKKLKYFIIILYCLYINFFNSKILLKNSKIVKMNKQQASRNKNKGKKGKQKKDDGIITRYILESIAFHSHTLQGYGPLKTENQETSCIIDNNKINATASQLKNLDKNDFYFFAIYDGHGHSGKDASFSACDYIQQYLELKSKQIKNMQKHKKIQNFLKTAFKTAEKKLNVSGIDYSSSGTCCVSVFIKGQNCYCANIGDSRAVLYRQTIPKNLKIQNIGIELSWDHKPTRPDEKERIMRKGGKIERLINNKKEHIGPYRVWEDEEGPGIAITRTIGDFGAKRVGLVSDPEIQHLELTQDDQMIIIASDGVWEVMSTGDVVGFVIGQIQEEKILKKQEPHNNLSEAICNEARRRWDNKNAEQQKILLASKNQDQSQYEMKGGQNNQKTQKRFGVCDDITVIVGIFQFKEEKIQVNTKVTTKQKKSKNKR